MEERKILSKNTFTPDQTHYEQAYAEMTKLSDLLLFGFVVLMALVLALGSIASKTPFFGRDNLVPLIALGLAFAVVIAQHFLLPKLSAKRAVKRVREAFGDVAALTVTVDEAGVSMHNAANDGTVRFPFGAFAKLSESRDLLLLRTYARQTVMVSKTGFTDGFDEASFKALMREKCPNAKCKWK
ncbi:MAG: YcxB family protein [Clostridia bacterium]|nr:YcxB family protein [Clostridia bacterium]